MVFNSFIFLVFMVIVFLLYWLLFNRIGRGVSNIYLIVISYIFYGWVSPKLCLVLFVCTLLTWLLGMGIRQQKGKNPPAAKFLCALSVLAVIGTLLYFKYTNFFIDCIAVVFHTNVNHLNIIVPLGISFYSLQMLTYTIEVYRGTLEAERDGVTYFAAMNFFAPLLSGPIGRAKDLLPQFKTKRVFDYGMVTQGFRNILWGLFMKVVVADRFGLYVDAVYSNIGQHSGTTVLVAATCYSIQIYCDFWGYSLMAKGVAEMFGIRLIQNFHRPYFADSIREFWQRWHISLSTWFRDYVYIPLGGGRCAKWRVYLNLIITFWVSGLWHGAALTFCLWGLLHGVIQVVEKMLGLHKMHNNRGFVKVLRIGITFMLVTFCWIFFRMPTVGDAFTAIGMIFTQPGSIFVDANTMLYMVLGIVVLLFKDFKDEYLPGQISLMSNKHIVIRVASCLVVTVAIILLGVLDGSQFIYFQF